MPTIVGGASCFFPEAPATVPGAPLADEAAPLATGTLADLPVALLFPDAAAGFAGALDAAPPPKVFPPDGLGEVGGVVAFIKSSGTLTAGAAVCGAPSGEFCALCVGAFTCDTATTDPFRPYDTTAKIITATTTAAAATVYPMFQPRFFAAACAGITVDA
jgi:hypothetical protein